MMMHFRSLKIEIRVPRDSELRFTKYTQRFGSLHQSICSPRKSDIAGSSLSLQAPQKRRLIVSNQRQGNINPYVISKGSRIEQPEEIQITKPALTHL